MLLKHEDPSSDPSTHMTNNSVNTQPVSPALRSLGLAGCQSSSRLSDPVSGKKTEWDRRVHRFTCAGMHYTHSKLKINISNSQSKSFLCRLPKAFSKDELVAKMERDVPESSRPSNGKYFNQAPQPQGLKLQTVFSRLHSLHYPNKYPDCLSLAQAPGCLLPG